jgi:hypothetical protein
MADDGTGAALNAKFRQYTTLPFSSLMIVGGSLIESPASAFITHLKLASYIVPLSKSVIADAGTSIT